MRRKPPQYKASLSAKAQLASIAGEITVKASAAKEDGSAIPPMFHSVAYSGGPVPKHTIKPALKHDYVLDLSGMTSAKNVKANLDHKSDQRVGHVTDYQNDGQQVLLSGVLSADTAHSVQVASSSQKGYTWEGSIEASLSEPRLLAAGKSATVNGRTVSGPLYIFGKSVLTDLAFVSHGADGGNQVTIAATAAKEEAMNEFDKYITKLGLDPETISAETRAELQISFDAKQEKKPTGSFATLAAEARREHERQESIKTMGLQACRENPLYADKIEQLVEAALESKADPEKFELELLRGSRMVSGQFQSRMARKDDPKVIEAAICMASGLPNIEKHYNEATLDAVDRSGLAKGFSIQQMLMQAAHTNGYSCRPGERIHPGNLRSILQCALPPAGFQAQLGFSTASLPNILGAVANKQILAGYMEEDQSWKEIAEIKPVSNFYTQNHYRMLDSLEYEEVGSGGELKHGTLGEETYTTAAKTYGKLLGLTRTQIINDDLGAFNDIRTRLGRGAAKKFGNVFWSAFINNSSFFTTALTNYIEGATTNLGTDGVGLGLMVKAFRQMTTPSADGSKRIGAGLNPSMILVPPELESNALIAYTNANLNAVAGSSANIFANRFRPVVQWRLSDSGYTGYSTTAFYMFGSEVKPMTVTLLNGNPAPTVESTDADFETLGIMFRGYHDFGCDKSEYLAGVKSKGAA